jgi:4-amino-4-deoxy-L-arabinose transferase-like glycosyltransferase
MAGIANLALALTYGFYLAFITYHIDCTRIFLLLLSLYFMASLLKYPGRKSALLFGAAAGLAAFAHSLGAFLVIIELLLVFVFLKQQMLNRIRLMSYSVVLVLLFGGLHYLIDTFYGTGWVFQEIKYY